MELLIGLIWESVIKKPETQFAPSIGFSISRHSVLAYLRANREKYL